MKRTLVTGGTGFIGSAVVRALVACGRNVRVLDDESRGKAGRLADISGHIELFHGDVCRLEDVSAAVKDCTTVLHFAAVNGTATFYERPDRVLEVAVKGTMNAIDASIAAGVSEFLCASSSEVYQTATRVPTDETASLVVPNPLNPRYSYGGGKIISELLTINYGRRYFDRAIVFRPHNVYGPDMGWDHVIPQLSVRMARLAASSAGPVRLPIQGTGTETRAFTHVNDFVEGLMYILNRGRHLEIYNVGTEEEIAISELAELIAAQFGRSADIQPQEVLPGSTGRRCPDVSKLRALGFIPRIKISEGLPETVRWYAERKDQAPVTV